MSRAPTPLKVLVPARMIAPGRWKIQIALGDATVSVITDDPNTSIERAQAISDAVNNTSLLESQNAKLLMILHEITENWKPPLDASQLREKVELARQAIAAAKGDK